MYSVSLLCVFIFIISSYIIFYNVGIIAIQKTPIQQSWLSIGAVFQFGIPVLFLIFRNSPDIRYLVFKYLSLFIMCYLHLYITKFNVSIPKAHIKTNLIIINCFIAYLVMCLIISVFKLGNSSISITGPVTGLLFKIETVSNCLFLIYSVSAICGSLCIDFFKVRKSVNLIKILNIIYELGLLIYVIRDKNSYLCFHFLSIMVLLMDANLIKIVCIDKGRYYNDR